MTATEAHAMGFPAFGDDWSENMNLKDYRNAKFSAAEAMSQVDRVTKAWWSLNSHRGLAISEQDISELEGIRERSIQMINSSVDRIVETASERQNNLTKYSDWRFVSIGEDCFSRAVLTRWGLKPSAALGERSLPFDLSVHPISSLIAILQSDFEGYLDPGNLEFVPKLGYCRNTHYNVGFNHELGEEYAENRFAKLRQTYQSRVERFNAILLERGKTCFVLHIRAPNLAKWQNVANLWEILRTRCSASDKRLVCVNTWATGRTASTERRDRIDLSGACMIDLHYPFEGYVWHKDAQTDGGHAFERDVIRQVSQQLDS